MSAPAAAPGDQAGPGGRAACWPLSPIEELDWYLESPGEPSLVQLETHVRGHLDQAAVGRALADVLAADPAARRRLAASSPWRRHLRWETGEAAAPASRDQDVPLTIVTWSDPAELAALRESLTTVPIPLRQRALRLILAAGPDRDALILQVHHSAFDGISALALLSAIGDTYRDLTGAAEATVPPAGAPAVCTSPAPVPAPAGQGPVATGPRIPGTVTRIARRLSGPARPGYGFTLWTVPVPRSPRDGAGPYPTVNDLLVTALVLAVHRWNAAGSAAREAGGRISISVPANIRDSRHRWTGPGNQSRLIRVGARPGDCAHPADLLARISAQVRVARERPRPGLDGASRMLATGWAPAALKRPAVRLARRLAAPLCTDTALASNLGLLPAPPSFGEAGEAFGETGEEGALWFSGPAPMPRGLCLGAVTTGGRLHLTLTYSRGLFDARAAADFAAVYRGALDELAPPGAARARAARAQAARGPWPDARPEREPT